MADRRTTTIGFGVALVVAGLFLAYNGITPLPFSQDRDPDGYLLSDSLIVDRAPRAVTTNDVELLRGHHDCMAQESFLLRLLNTDDVRVRGEATGSDSLFMGLAPAGAVEGYLSGVDHEEITEWNCNVDDITEVEYTRYQGTAVPTAPGAETFWAAAVSGPGEQTLDWTIESGDWTLVLMNADASSGVSADLRFGAQVSDRLDVVAWLTFLGGVIVTVVGGWLFYLGARRSDGKTTISDDQGSTLLRQKAETLPPPVASGN